MELLIGLGATWVAAAALVTFGLARAGGHSSFHLDQPRTPVHH